MTTKNSDTADHNGWIALFKERSLLSKLTIAMKIYSLKTVVGSDDFSSIIMSIGHSCEGLYDCFKVAPWEKRCC